MNEDEIERFEKAEAQLSGLYEEVSNLAKKAPDGPLNTFKLKFVNTVLAELNALLPKGRRPFDDFAQFDAAELPSASDVVLILRQYANCLEELRADHVDQQYDGKWYWRIDGEVTELRAKPPAKLGNK